MGVAHTRKVVARVERVERGGAVRAAKAVRRAKNVREAARP